MSFRGLLLPLLTIALAIALIACGSDDDEVLPDNGNGVPPTEAPANGDDNGDADNGITGNGGGNGGGSGFGSGTGTLTIGDETWEFTGIGCVFSAAEAGNPDFPFNLAGFGQSADGARLQLNADIYDPSGQERHEGDDVRHNIGIYDVDNFADPTVDWQSVSGFFAEGNDTVLTINGKNVHGVGVFDDGTTDDIETVPGELNVTCP